MIREKVGSSQPFPVSFLIPSSFHSHLPAYEDGTVCSETSAYKLQKPGYYPKESIKHTEHGESLKSGKFIICITTEMNVRLVICTKTELN